MLNGFFINPISALRWKNFETHLDHISQLDAKKIIFQWTSGHGHSFYPSKIYDQNPTLSGDRDFLERLFRTAEDREIEIWIGLDACRTTTEFHYDKSLNAIADRCKTTASELADLYQNFRSFTGFYIPIELEEPLKKRSIDFLDRVVSHCHQIGFPVACSAAEPRPILTGRHYEFNERDQQWIGRVKRLRQNWRRSWQKAIDLTKLDVLIIRDLIGVGRESNIEVDLNYFTSVKKWVSVPLYHTDFQNSIETARSADALIGFSYHDHELDPPENHRPKSRDELREKADRAEKFLRDRCMIDGQIVSVLDTRYSADAPQNQWQEDADWITGLYVGAQSLHYATTGESSAADHARESWQALHKLSNVSGTPGIVARYFLDHVDGDLGSGRKRWHKNTDGIYWIGDISRDQLSGHIFGLATYFDHVATDDEKKIIKNDVEAITDLIIENRMMSIDPDGEPCIHANFWVSPLFALSFLKSAYHITEKEAYQEKYLDLINPHYFLGHSLKDARVSANPFFQHYHQDSPLYHFLQYENDTQIVKIILRICDYLYIDTHRHGNAFLMIDHAISHPESESGRKAVEELYRFDVEQLNVSIWDRNARELLKNSDLPRGVRTTLAYILGDREDLPNGRGNYLPIEYRPPKEFGWNYYAGEEAHRSSGRTGCHGDHVQYSGVDYLLTYWMARYHGLIG